MRDDILLKLQRIIEGNDRITWDLFPEIYNGFLEADELSLAEDRMLQLVASAVQTCMDDKVISTASSDKITEYEDGLGLSGEGLTLDERRQQVIDYINRSRVINEDTLHSLVQSKAVGYTVYEKTDPQELTLGIFSEEDDDQGALISVGIVDEIRPVIPQNLELYAGVESSIDMPLAINHAHFSALCVSLGVLEWSPVPPPPPPPTENQYLYGVMDDTSEYELLTIDNLPTAMMENTGYLNFHAEFIDDPNLSWVMGNTSIMENTGYLNFHAEFIDDPNLSWVMGNTSIMEASLPAPQILEAYVTANGSSETSNTICSAGTTYTLYDASGNTIPYDSTKSYLNYWSYTYNGDTVSGYFRYFETYSDTVLKGRPSEGTRFYKLMIRVDAPFRFIKLWAKTSSNKINFQSNVTNTSSPSSVFFYELYTDETLTQRFSKDPTKTYESGSLVNGVWTPREIQSLSDMPSTTTSDSSEREITWIIQTSNGSDYLWCITNWTSSDIYFSAPDGKLGFTFLELST